MTSTRLCRWISPGLRRKSGSVPVARSCAAVHPDGFSLIEVVIALGIFAFAAVGLIALFSMGLTANRESTEKLLSANIATSILGRWRALPTSAITDLSLPDLLTSADNSSVPVLLTEEGTKATSAAQARLALIYKITAPDPATTPSGGFSQVYLYFYWPPQALKAKSTGRFEISTSIALP